MMRLILQYTSGDGYTYYCTNTHPVVYESAEALLVDFMNAAEAAQRGISEFYFLSVKFDVSDFYERVDQKYVNSYPDFKYLHTEHGSYLECPPNIMTLDEYFADALVA